jgi:hypothetical protein
MKLWFLNFVKQLTPPFVIKYRQNELIRTRKSSTEFSGTFQLMFTIPEI